MVVENRAKPTGLFKHRGVRLGRVLPRRGRSRRPMSSPTRRPSRRRNYDTLRIYAYAWIISGPRLVPIQDASIEDVCVILRNRCGEVLVLRSGRL